MTYLITEARRTHILPVAVAIEATDPPHPAGISVRTALRTVFHLSSYRRAALIDDRPVALWGITGSLIDDEGEAWVALTPAARARPFAAARETLAEIAGMMATRRVIRSSLLCHDARAQRFARWLGFTVEEETAVNGMAFFKAALRRP